MIAHVTLAVKLVPRVQKLPVVALSDQAFQFFYGKPATEIDLLESRALFAKETLRFAAGRSSGFEVELHSL
jgi:hypothetical protein